MKYVLFALAILLILVGGYSIFTGLPIIEVERGWASVIAGTTALVGGALLFGVGWLVRALEQLRAAVLATGKNALSAPLALADRDFHSDEAHEDRQPLRAETAAPIAWPPQTSPAPSADTQKEALLAAYAARGARRQEARQEVRQEVRQDIRRDVRQEVSRAVRSDLHDEVRQDVHEEVFDEDEFAAEAESILRTPLTQDDRPVREKPAANIRDFWRRKADEKKSPLSPPFQKKPLGAVASVFDTHPKPLAAANAPLPEPQDDDFATAGGREADEWLQSNFAQPGNAPEPAPMADEMPADFDSYEPVGEKHVAPPTAAATNEVETDGEQGEEPAVIGHYEAEGTSYTMFSDGSIEAQSERGVARFNSMAELKAYFETQETPQ